MTIPLISVLFLYLLFVVVWIIFSFIALFHIIKYGQVNFLTFFTTFIYIAGSIVILYLSYGYLSQIDWEIGLTIFQGSTNMFGVSNF